MITEAAKLTTAFIVCYPFTMQGAFALPKYCGTNISFDREPQNALEYLVSVRNEASQIPSVVSISHDVSGCSTVDSVVGSNIGTSPTGGGESGRYNCTKTSPGSQIEFRLV